MRDSRLFRGGPRREDRRFSQKFGGRGRRFCRVKSCRRRRRRRRFSTKEKFRSSVWDCLRIIPPFLHVLSFTVRWFWYETPTATFHAVPFFQIVSPYRTENASFSSPSISGIKKKKRGPRWLIFQNVLWFNKTYHVLWLCKVLKFTEYP